MKPWRDPRTNGFATLAVGAVGSALVATVLAVTVSSAADDGGKSAKRKPAAAAGKAPETFRVYLDPVGSDANDGRDPARPVLTLDRAQKVVAEAKPTTDVEIRIKQGTYQAPQTVWTTYVPGRTVTFLPVDYQYGKEIGQFAGRPVFRGDGSGGFWLRAELPPGHPGGDTALRFYYLRVEQYSNGGVMVDGGTAKDPSGVLKGLTAGLNGNTVYGMSFNSIGSKYVGSGIGYGAVDLVNSKRNIIEKNEFTKIENNGPPSQEALVHGVYLAHLSSDNLIRDNRFDTVSGDPIRTRNASGRNEISGNTFVRAGSKAYFSDWFQRDATGRDPRECASVGNRFHGNTLESGYRGEAKHWTASPGGPTFTGGPGCTPGPAQRVQSWNNLPR